MRLHIFKADPEIIQWIDERAAFYKRSRSEQIMWLLGRLMAAQKDGTNLISKEFLFHKNKP